MSPEALTALFVALAEALAAIREAWTKRRKEQATDATPAAEALDAHIRQLIAEALERAKHRQPQAEAAGSDHPLTLGADALKIHIDALVDDALQRARGGVSRLDAHPSDADSDPNPSTAGAAPPETAVGGGEPEADANEKSGPASP